VFPWKHGTKTWYTCWNAAEKAIGKRFHLHDLKRFSGELAMRAGDSDVQAMLESQGHHKIPFTTGLLATGAGGTAGGFANMIRNGGKGFGRGGIIGALVSAGLLSGADMLLPSKKGMPKGVSAPPSGTISTPKLLKRQEIIDREAGIKRK
jgi:hypothetical protein